MMDDGNASSEERIFSLQLIIHKMEEELRLYRNGTSAAELMDVIHERDVEIETWRSKCEERDEKLKRIAKTSADVLERYERLQKDLVRQQEKKQLEDVHIQNMINEHQNLQKQLKERTMEVTRLQDIISEKDDEIGTLRLAMWDKEQSKAQDGEESQRRLQEQQIKHEFELKAVQIATEKLENVIRESQDNEARLTQEVHHWKTCADEQDQSILSLQKRCAVLVKEKNERLQRLDEERQEMVTQVQQFRENMSNNMAQKDENLRKKDDKIRELTFQVNILQQEIKLKNQRIAQGFGGEPVIVAPTAASIAKAISGKESRTVLAERTNKLTVFDEGLEKVGKKSSVMIVDYSSNDQGKDTRSLIRD